jgi:hypothetical protein
MFFCVTKIVSDTTRTKFCDALSLLFEVHHGLRNPLHKDDLDCYQGKINFLLATLVDIGLPWSKSQCNSIKYHWPRHWGQTRQVRSCMVPASFNVSASLCVLTFVIYDVLFDVSNDVCSQCMFCALQELGCSANEKSLIGALPRRNAKKTLQTYKRSLQHRGPAR